MKENHSPTQTAMMAQFARIFLSWRRYLQRRLNPSGLTLKQLYVLRQLLRDDYLYPSDIAEMLFCDRPTASVVLDNLEKHGWIRREQEEENRKYTRVFITANGKEKLASVQLHSRTEFDLFSDFTLDEKVEFARLLRKLSVRTEKIADAVPENQK